MNLLVMIRMMTMDELISKILMGVRSKGLNPRSRGNGRNAVLFDGVELIEIFDLRFCWLDN